MRWANFCRATGAIRSGSHLTVGNKLQLFCDDSDCGEEFGGLDAAGCQMGDEFAVGGEEIVVGEFAGESPGNLFERMRRNIRLSNLRDEEMDFEFVGSVGIEMADAGDFDGFDEGDAEFFAEFAGKGLLERFAAADFSAGKFPFEGGSVAAAALADEDAAVGTFDDCCNDLDHI
jgi:hypothetical protein